MREDRNAEQIVRKDARGCFVESLNDSFEIGKMHLFFAVYDVTKPEGQRQTDKVHIYISADEFLELCRKADSGEMRKALAGRKKAGDQSPLYEHLGGTSAERLARSGRERADGKSLSRTLKLIPGSRSDLLFVADSGPGETTATGLIVPRFGKTPEDHVAVSLSFDALCELLMITRAHYQAWLTAWYMRRPPEKRPSGREER